MTKKPSYEELEQRVAELEKRLRPREVEEAEMKISEVFCSMVEDMPALMCRFLPDGTLTFVNRNLCDYFGRKREHLIGQNIFQFIPEEERQQVRCRFISLTRESPVVTYEHQVIASDGSRRWQQRTDRALFDEAGNLKEYQCLSLDVTDRKRVEEALREKEAIFSAFLEHSPIYVFFKDKHIRSIHLSKNYEKMLGMPLHEAIGKPMDELFPSDVAKGMIADDMRVLSEGKRVDVVEELGGRIYETIKFPVLKNGAPFVLAGFTMDITERKQVEEALQESEKRYKQLFNHAPAGIYELDFLKQRFIAVNDVMCKYTGYSEEEFLAMNFYDILPDDAKALCTQRISKLMAGESVPEAVEYKITRKDGQELWVALKIKPVYENGKVKGVTTVVHDITERCKVEQKLRQSEERLRALSAELMKAQENERIRISKELHDEIGHSLAILKHRVRSIGKSLLAHQPELSNDGDAAVELIDELLEKLRQISKDLNPAILENLGLSPALRCLAESFMEEYKIPVSVTIDETDGLFSKETARNLYRIFQEALTNITKHANANHVNVQIRRETENVYFLIEDDGQGFDINEARGRDARCKGLGLTVMEERAFLIGGTLEISSFKGERGTKMLLAVPVDNGRVN